MEDFVSYELAVKLKEKGFRKPCIAHYTCLDKNVLKFNITTDCIRGSNFKVLNNDYKIFTDVPTISQVLKWLREEKELHIEIYMYHNRYLWEIYNTEIYDADFTQKSEKYSEIEYKTWELAALAGIEHAIDNLI